VPPDDDSGHRETKAAGAGGVPAMLPVGGKVDSRTLSSAVSRIGSTAAVSSGPAAAGTSSATGAT